MSEERPWLFVTFRPKFETLDEITGGDQIRPYELFSNLAEAGHRVHVWETDNPQHGERTYCNGNLQVRQLTIRSGLSGNLLYARDMRRVLDEQLAWARENGYERVCYYQQIPCSVFFRWRMIPLLSQPGLLAVDHARQLGMTFWAAVHDISPDHELAQYARVGSGPKARYSRLKARIHGWIQDTFLPKADFISAVSTPVKDLIVERYGIEPERVGLYMSGYNPTIFEAMSDWEAPATNESWTIGYLGSPSDVSVELLIKSVQLIGRDNVRLLLSGRGMQAQLDSFRDQWSNIEVVEGIKYSGFTKMANHVDMWIVACDDPYALDLAWELKMPHCMVSGRPVVRTDGKATQTSGFQDHLFVSGHTAEEVAETARFVIDNPEEAKRRACSGRAAVVANFNWPAITHRLVKDFNAATWRNN